MVDLHSLKGNGTREYFFKAFFYGLAVAFLFFIPFILFDNGYFLFYGDYNVQQVPFYQMCHDAVRSGNIGWSWTTDLGANFIGSYTFYLLGSPFFWLTIPFPSWMVPHLMGPLLMLKFACASLTSFNYLRRYVRSPEYAVVGGMLYAFSGFSVYNIFFNHFHEAIIFFPLMLWALDEYMYKRRRGVFAVTVFFCAMVNWYFFVGQVVFTLIYWFVRLLSRSWTLSVRDFLLLACEAVIGVLSASVLLVPTVLAAIQNPRVDNPPSGWGTLLYDWNQRYIHILECFFFPPDIPARPNFTPNSEAKWASLGAWFPLMSMTGVFAFFRNEKKHWLRTLIGILFLMAFVPILNAAFQLFNMSYYARWFYMLTLMLSLASVLALQSLRSDWPRAIKWTLGITLGIALPIGLMPNQSSDGKTVFGLEDYPTRFWPYVAIALLSLALFTISFRFFRNRKQFLHYLMGGITLITVVYAAYFIALGKTQSDDTHKWMIPYSLNKGEEINLPDSEEFSRIDIFDGMDNQAMYWQKPTIQAFHSIVPGSVMEFYPSIGVQRDVGSRPETKYYGLRGLTSCRWLFDPVSTGKTFVGEDGAAAMPGWSYYATQNGCDIYRNDYFIPMGFSYNGYVTRSEYNDLAEDDRNRLLLKAVVLEDDDVSANAQGLEHLDPNAQDYSQDAYFSDCIARAEESCSSFTTDNSGFSAAFTSEKSRLVFFSVPWEGGWSAEVNGAPAEIVKVNVGFMAVRVPAGTSQIRFYYKTPGLTLGAAATAGGILLFLFYCFMTRRYDRRNKRKRRIYRVIKLPLPHFSGAAGKVQPPAQQGTEDTAQHETKG